MAAPAPPPSAVEDGPLSPDALRAVLAAEWLRPLDAPRERLVRAAGSASRATVRVFASSTFADFIDERRALNTELVPELSRRCAERGLDLVFVDLMWGVPEGTVTADTCRLCMDEVDAGVRANGAPFFLYLAGSRYGWVPPRGEIPIDDALRGPPVRWVDGVSVTAMELLHGAGRGGRNLNALFCVRDEAYALSRAAALPAERRGTFIDAKAHQNVLVSHVLGEYGGEGDEGREGDEVVGASGSSIIKYNPLVAVSGDGAGAMAPLPPADFSDFVHRVTEGLWRKIAAQYLPLPAGAAAGSLPAQSAQHEAALAAALSSAAPRSRMRDAITAAVAAAARSGGVVALVGASGAGKSTLLAQAMSALREGGSPVVPHFTSTADRSEEVRSLAARLVVGVRRAATAEAVLSPPEAAPAPAALTPAADEGNDVPGDTGKACALAVSVLRGASRPPLAPPLVLAVDAVNQLQAPDAIARLSWLPAPGELPPGLVVLVSTTPGAEADALRGRPDTTVVEAGPLDDAEARALVVDVLWSRYAKRLAPANLDALLAKAPGARSPLWQHLALSRLHVLGRGGTEAQGGTLPALIAGLPPMVVGEGGLLSVVLDAAEARGGVSLVRALLLAATVSPSGLRASEALVAVPCVAAALDALDVPAGSGTTQSPEPLPPRTWALLRAAVAVCLRPVAAGAEEITAPAHALVADGVLARYGAAAVAAARRALAGWYESGAAAALPERRATEAPVLYAALGDAPALARSLCCAAVVRLANRDDSSAYRFLALARAADASGKGTYDDAAAALVAWADAELDASVLEERVLLDGVAALCDSDRMCQLPRALALRERALSAKIAAEGDDHADVASTLNDMASVHRTLGNTDNALELFDRALAIRRKALGENHVDVAVTLNNIANVHYSLGANRKALEYYDRALAIARLTLGEEHVDIAKKLDNMAIVHYALGDFGQALELHDRALAIKLKALGEDHVSVAGTLNYMAYSHSALGNASTALAHFDRALAIRRKALGEDHVDVAASLNNVGLMHSKLGDTGRALELFDRALAVRRKALGEHHVLVAETLSNTGLVYSALGDYARALELFDRVLAIVRAALGEEHAYVAEPLNDAGLVHFQLGDTARALEHFARALAIRQKALGDDHVLVADTLANTGLVQLKLGDAGGARELFDRALVIRRKALGEVHADVAETLDHLATAHEALGDSGAAAELRARTQAIRADKK